MPTLQLLFSLIVPLVKIKLQMNCSIFVWITSASDFHCSCKQILQLYRIGSVPFPFFPLFLRYFAMIIPRWHWHFVVINWLGHYHQEEVGSSYIYNKMLFITEWGEMGKKHPFFVLKSLISQLFCWNWREKCYFFPFSFSREALKGPNQTQIGALSLEFSADEWVFEVEGLIISHSDSPRHQHPTILGLTLFYGKLCQTTSTRLCNTQNLDFFIFFSV